MATTRRYLKIVAGLVVLVLAAILLIPFSGSGVSTTVDFEAVLGDTAEIERGRYLAIAGNCASCHTTAEGEFMAGGLPFETPFGTIYSTNITPDVDTGIGAWTGEDFLKSMRLGLRPNGEHLYPAFPYTSFTRVTDEDVAAIFAYLRNIPAVRQAAPENDMPFPFNQRVLMAFWKALFFDDGVFAPDESQTEDWNRGAYLVEALAHCGACHTPRNALGAEDQDRHMAGGVYLDKVRSGEYRPWSAPNLTPSDRGLDLWSHDELTTYLGTGQNEFLESFGPMNEVIINSTRHLAEQDLDAMAVYLKSLPEQAEAAGAVADERVMGRGRTIYNLHCGTCHLPTGLGDPEMAPKLNQGSLVVQSDNPASMINAILYSPELPETDLPGRWREPMDEHRYLLDDEEVAAVATYIRQSWDNNAGLVTADQVAIQR